MNNGTISIIIGIAIFAFSLGNFLGKLTGELEGIGIGHQEVASGEVICKKALDAWFCGYKNELYEEE